MARLLFFLFFAIFATVAFYWGENIFLRPSAFEQAGTGSLRKFYPPSVIHLESNIRQRAPDQIERWVINSNKVQLEMRKIPGYHLRSVANVSSGFTATIFPRTNLYLTDFIPLVNGDNQIEVEWESRLENHSKKRQTIWIVFPNEPSE